MDKAATHVPVLRRSAGSIQDLYALCQKRLVIQVAALTGDVAVAEDLVQEAFGRCVARWGEVSSYEDPESWVRAVAFNLAHSRWRRIARSARVGETAKERVSARPKRGEHQSPCCGEPTPL